MAYLEFEDGLGFGQHQSAGKVNGTKADWRQATFVLLHASTRWNILIVYFPFTTL